MKMDELFETKLLEKSTKRFDESIAQLIRTLIITNGLLMFAFLIVLTTISQEEIVANDMLRAKTKRIYGDECYFSAGAAIIIKMAEGASVPVWNVLYLTLLHIINGYRSVIGIEISKVYKSVFLSFVALSFAAIIYSVSGLTNLSENIINLKAPFYPESIVCKGGGAKYELNVNGLVTYKNTISDLSNLTPTGGMGFMLQGIGSAAQTYVNSIAYIVLGVSSVVLLFVIVGKCKNFNS
jgi:hypothetical protein